MTLLPDVLAPRDLPWAELQAARLDGELFELGAAYCALDALEGPRHRASSLLAGRSPRFVVALESAAWVWGGGRAPERPTFAVAPEARAQVKSGAPALVRELVLEPGDVTRWPDAAATTPMRTLLDLARGDTPDAALVDLARAAELTRSAVGTALERLRRLPGSRRAADRLGRLLPG